MPGPIPARSTTTRPGSGPRRTSPGHTSRTRPEFSSSTSRIGPVRTGSPTCWRAASRHLFAPAAFTLSLIKEGRLKALAVSSPTDMREPIAVPSARAEGVDYEYSTWYGFLAPAKTPKTVVEALNRAIADVSQDPDLKAKIIAQGIAPRFKPLADMDAHVESEVNRLRPVLDAIGAAANN